MADDSFNDNSNLHDDTSLREPDSHGQAAMLLVESLIHGLIARSILSVQEAVSIVDVAREVKMEVAVELGDSPAGLRKSLALLEAVSASLKMDLPRG